MFPSIHNSPIRKYNIYCPTLLTLTLEKHKGDKTIPYDDVTRKNSIEVLRESSHLPCLKLADKKCHIKRKTDAGR